MLTQGEVRTVRIHWAFHFGPYFLILEKGDRIVIEKIDFPGPGKCWASWKDGRGDIITNWLYTSDVEVRTKPKKKRPSHA